MAAIVIAIFLIDAILITAGFAWEGGRSQRRLEEWAESNGFRLLDAKHQPTRWLSLLRNAGRGQPFYRIRVVEKDGNVRTGSALCRGCVLGLLTDPVIVQWNDHPSPPGFPVITPNQSSRNDQ